METALAIGLAIVAVAATLANPESRQGRRLTNVAAVALAVAALAVGVSPIAWQASLSVVALGFAAVLAFLLWDRKHLAGLAGWDCVVDGVEPSEQAPNFWAVMIYATSESRGSVSYDDVQVRVRHEELMDSPWTTGWPNIQDSQHANRPGFVVGFPNNFDGNSGDDGLRDGAYLAEWFLRHANGWRRLTPPHRFVVRNGRVVSSKHPWRRL